MMDVPTLDTWTTGQRVGAKDLNDNTYRPAAFLDNDRPTGCIYLSSDWAHDGSVNEYQVPLDETAWASGMTVRSNGLVADEPGVYLVTASVAWNMDTLGTNYVATRFKYGDTYTDYRDFDDANLASSQVAPVTIMEEVLLERGDLLTLWAYQSSGGSLDLAGGASNSVGLVCHLKAVWVASADDTVVGALSSPRTWATSDVPTATLMNSEVRDQWQFLLSPPRCKATGGTVSLTTATSTTVPFSTTAWDTHSSLSSNNLTLPVDGFYQVLTQARFPLTSGVGRRLLFVSYRTAADAQIRSYMFQVNAHNNGYTRVHGPLVISASAGQKIRLFAYQDSGASITVSDAFLSYRWLGRVS